MKTLSLQWRITLMTALLIGATCIFMNVLIGYSGSHYMDSIGSYVTGYGDTDKGEPDFFDPEHEKLDRELTIVINGAQESFIATNWYITAAATLLGGVLAYFLSGHALKPLRTFTARVEKVQPNNLTDMKITEEVPPELRQFVKSFNLMLDRLDEGFTAQRQFTGNAAHELRTPLSLMQAQLELFSAEHPDVSPETAEFLRLLREQTERMTQMTKTLLEMTENAIRYNRFDGTVNITVTHKDNQLVITVADTGYGIPEQYRESIFQPFFRVDKSRSREYGGVGLGLSLVWEIVALHNRKVRVEESSEKGTAIAVKFPTDVIKI